MKNTDAIARVRENDVKHIKRLVSIEGRNVLEVGCGTARITFPLAEEAGEITAIDIDSNAISDAKRRNRFENITFLVEDIETTRLGKRFDVILSTWLGYMFLSDIPKAISNISDHLEDDGVFLLCCGSPENEYNQIVDLLVEENIKSITFYKGLEAHLSKHFTFQKHILKGEISFSHIDEVFDRFKSELKTEHGSAMNEQHERRLIEYLKQKDTLTIGWDSQAYLCKKR